MVRTVTSGGGAAGEEGQPSVPRTASHEVGGVKRDHAPRDQRAALTDDGTRRVRVTPDVEAAAVGAGVPALVAARAGGEARLTLTLTLSLSLTLTLTLTLT